MENKTTTELLNALGKLEDEDFNTGGKYEKLYNELKSREPFFTLLDDGMDGSLGNLLNRVEKLEKEVKLLKRHKHDDKNGDVLVRI